MQRINFDGRGDQFHTPSLHPQQTSEQHRILQMSPLLEAPQIVTPHLTAATNSDREDDPTNAHIVSLSHDLARYRGERDILEGGAFIDKFLEEQVQALGLFRTIECISLGLLTEMRQLTREMNDSQGQEFKKKVQLVLISKNYRPIDARYYSELSALIEYVKSIQKVFPNILATAPFYLENQAEAIRIAEILFLLDLWISHPDYLGGLIPSRELYNDDNKETHYQKMGPRFRNILTRGAIWYHCLTGNREHDLAEGHKLNRSLEKLKDTELTAIDLNQLPIDFPFLASFSDTLPNYGISYFIKILFFSPWVKIMLIKKNQYSLEKVIILFIQQYGEQFLAYKNQGIISPVVQSLLDIFDHRRLLEFIKKSIGTPSAKKREKRGNDLLPAARVNNVSVSHIRLVENHIVFSGKFPQDFGCEVRVENQENWTTLGPDGDISGLLRVDTPLKIYLRATNGVTLVPNYLSFKSPEYQYFETATPKVKSDYLLSQALVYGQSHTVGKIFDNWRYPEFLKLSLSLDGGATWQSFGQDDVLSLHNFREGTVQFAFSFIGQTPRSDSRKLTKTYKNDTPKDTGSSNRSSGASSTTGGIQLGVARLIDQTVPLPASPHPELPQEPPDSPESLDEERALMLSIELEAGRYILARDATTGIYRISFTDENFSEYVFDCCEGKKHSNVGNSFFGLVGDSIRMYILQKEKERIAEIENKREKEIVQKFEKTEEYVYGLFSHLVTVPRTRVLAHALEDCFQNGGFLGGVLHNPLQQPYYLAIMHQLNRHGIHISTSRLDDDGKESPRGLRFAISLSVEGETNIGATIYSETKPPYYSIKLNGTYGPILTMGMNEFMVELLLLFGLIGRERMPDISGAKGKQIRSQSRLKFPDDILLDLLRSESPIRKSILLTHQSFLRSELILEAKERFENREGKLCFGITPGSIEGVKHFQIESRKSMEDIRGAHPLTQVVVVEEKILSTGDGEGDPHIYERIAEIPRLQKYLVLRIIVTLSQKPYKNKEPFTHSMKDVFFEYWNTFSPEQKGKVAIALQKNTDSFIDFEIQTQSGSRNFLQGLLTFWKSRGVRMRHIDPVLTTVRDFLEFLQNYEQKGTIFAK